MSPVPEHPVADTPYGVRGPYWSCNQDAQGNGVHTGVDYAAPAGSRVIAARPGTLVHCNYGSAFGYHQVAIRCPDGTRDFYAHMRSRRAEGDVEAGEKVGEVGTEGNVTGPHLHFERHATNTGGWSCGIVRDPRPSIEWEGDEMTEDEWDRMAALIASVWDERILVTQPGTGQDTHKAARQVLRETWQKVTKAT